MILIEDCPVCGQKLKETKHPAYYFCKKCSRVWNINDLEFESVQNKMDQWL